MGRACGTTPCCSLSSAADPATGTILGICAEACIALATLVQSFVSSMSVSGKVEVGLCVGVCAEVQCPIETKCGDVQAPARLIVWKPWVLSWPHEKGIPCSNPSVKLAAAWLRASLERVCMW